MAAPIVAMPRNEYGVPLPTYSTRENTITSRSPSSALLCIDSEDRFRDYTVSRASTSGTGVNSPFDFTIQKNESLMNGFFTRLAVTEVVFPWVIPNINDRTDAVNVALYDISGSVPVLVRREEVAIDRGFATPAQIAAAMTVAITTEFTEIPSFVMSYGEDPFGAPGLAGGAGCAFYWDTVVGPYEICFEPLTPNTANYPYGPQTKQLFDVLGLDARNSVPQDTGTGAGGYTLCQSIRYIDIVCSQLVNNQAVKDTMSQVIARDVLCRLYINTPTDQSTVAPDSATFCPPGCAPTVIYRDFATPKQIQWMGNQPIPGFLRFEVFDDNGENLQFADGASGAENLNRTNWSLSILVSEN